MYELAKVSVNNMGNEYRSAERRSNDGKNPAEEDKENEAAYEQNDNLVAN